MTAKLVEIAGPKVKVQADRARDAGAKLAAEPEIMRAAERITAEMGPAPLVPTMGVSSTDSRSFPRRRDPDVRRLRAVVDPENTGVHGLNEHIGVRQLNDGREFMYRMIRALATD